MRSKRLSLALVAVTTTALATISPLAANASSSPETTQSTSSKDKGSSSKDEDGSSKDASGQKQDTSKDLDSKPSDSADPKDADSQASPEKDAGTKPEETPKPKTPAQVEAEKCRAEIDAAYQAHKKAVDEGTAGSSFMGPKELALGVLNGYGSSGLPKLPECATAPDPETGQDKKPPVKFPEWAKSAEPSPEMEEAFEWIGTIITVVGAMLQAVLILAKINPEMLDPLRHALKGLGIKF